MAEVRRITSPATDIDSRIRDLRGLLWASIDNDDSLNLDQLTVAESLSDKAGKILVGIVKKNAIMMIDFALEAERKEGKRPAEAIYQGCLIRFRPIMMTTMAALMGTLPIALGFGAGAESRRPLGLCVVGGLLFSQLITLYITPVIYIYLDLFQEKISKRFSVFRSKEGLVKQGNE